MIKRVREHVAAYLLEHPCIDCGERDIQVLDFDHRDSTTKTREIGLMVIRGMLVGDRASGIGKCVVRCANCHRRRTARDWSHWRYLWLAERGLIPG
jgi:hypothetical protein